MTVGDSWPKGLGVQVWSVGHHPLLAGATPPPDTPSPLLVLTLLPSVAVSSGLLEGQKGP